MKTKRKWLLLFVPLLGASWQLYLHSPLGSATSVFGEAGYLTLRLTLDHHAPGSLYTVDSQSEGFVSLRPTCEIDDNALTNAIQVYGTADVSAAIENKLSAGFKVAPENWSKLAVNADLTGVQGIQAVYSDSKVELLSTQSILALRENLLNQKGCFAAVMYELEQGYEVCQTEAVIVSDLVYKVTRGERSTFGFDTVIDKILGLGGLSTADNSATETIDGSKMYHAVKLHRSKLGNNCNLLEKVVGQNGGSEPMPASGDGTVAMNNSGRDETPYGL